MSEQEVCLYCASPARRGKTTCYFHTGSTGRKYDYDRATQQTRRRVTEHKASKVRIKKRKAAEAAREEAS